MVKTLFGEKCADICVMKGSFLSVLQTRHALPEEDQLLISNAFTPRLYKEGTYLFHGGNICRELFFISNGVLKILTIDKKGDDRVYYFLRERQLCTIMPSFLQEQPAPESIQAACDAAVLAISKTELYDLYSKIPYLKPLIDEMIQQNLLNKIALKNIYSGESAEARYQLFLQQQPEVALRVPLSDIASYLEMTPQSLSRIRKGLSERQ